MGRAAFLLPAGRIVPFKARPPVTEKEGGMGQPSYAAACAGVKHRAGHGAVSRSISVVPSSKTTVAPGAGWMTPVRSVETTAPSTLTCGLAKSFDVQETPSAGMAQSATVRQAGVWQGPVSVAMPGSKLPTLTPL